MILKRLTIFHYKNITQAELSMSDKINCFIGMNGEGKTNLLDAIYFLSMCKSSTTSQDSQAIMHGEDMMALQGDYEREDGTSEVIHCGLKRGQKKILRRGKKAYKRLAEHIGFIPLIMVSPADQLLISGGSEERRRFLDIVISQYNIKYLDSLIRYNKALLQRNAMLKMENEPDSDIIDLWEEQMAREGEYIFSCRQAYIQAFTPIFRHYYETISLNHENVHLGYISHCQRGPLLETIQNGRQKDRIMGFSLHGIHRDDLEMLIGGYPIKREGSQGQNKTFLTALKLAQFDFLKHTGNNTSPILLLDDIFDKLDAKRVEQIVSLVSEDNFGQIFITDTNRDHLDKILRHTAHEYKLYNVKNGEISL